MTDTLWAPWRMDYIVQPKPDGCVFCPSMDGGESRFKEHLILYAARHAYVMMNRYPYAHAHLLVIPFRHVDRLEKLTAEERRELFQLWFEAENVILEEIKPQGVNLGMNIGQAAGAGIHEHLHAHVVPRWYGDTNFMPMLADARIMPEHLDATYARLKAAFERRL